jgi:phospholipid-translocating ATPase
MAPVPEKESNALWASSMSEYPLQSLRRNKNRAGYIPLGTETPTGSPNMPSAVRAAAASTSRVSKRNGGKGRQDRYTDDPEEEAGLLDGQEYTEETPAPPRAHSPPEARGFLKSRKKALKDQSRTIPFRPPGASISLFIHFF